MWCRHCKQDVPAVAPATDGAVHCARCHGTLDQPAFATGVSDAGVGLDQESRRTAEPQKLLAGLDDAYRLDDMRRTIRGAQRRAGNAPRMLRFDPPELFVEQARVEPPVAESSKQRVDQPIRDSHRPTQWAAWALALAGAMGLGAGLGLMFWSLTEARPELWDWGVGATLGGQGLLIIGLVQLIAGLWNSSRTANNTLRGVHQELRRLGRTTESLLGANSSTAANFYADLARGASPEMLLANLKGQVDALSSYVTRD
ncbi:hypothetical protein Pla123a_04690 [Posidoniimonas polymericola]|uniref:Uncharacterized protein n=1 Tax=Posidoniimonas polymericola TaxID=2528002 RepID=A0A5C5ZEC3_9BACT|nr:hypothetical protein [Posidoniimonas polymericola]TWT85662.1 hypothetical protein Pla123a_04690 [Posidoniimonas polymericola]